MKRSYEFSSIGYAQFIQDCRTRKQRKINMAVSTGILLGLVAFGLLNKELMMIYGINAGISVITDYLL